MAPTISFTSQSSGVSVTPCTMQNAMAHLHAVWGG
jgi:hypothetical protein